MVFKYEWTTKEAGNYAIRKRDAKKEKAGGEIEPKGKQTSDTHYFLFADKKDTDTMYNLYQANAILRTITYEYVYKGTDKKSLSHYLTKADIANVLENIKSYKNKTIRIETPPPKVDRNTKAKNEKVILKNAKEYLEKTYGKNNTKKALNLLIRRKEKERELKEKIKQMKKEVKQVEKEITAIDKEIYRKTTDTLNKKPAADNLADMVIQGGTFKSFVNQLYGIAKIQEKIEKANIRQQIYRGRENTKAGKPVRTSRGRPKKET